MIGQYKYVIYKFGKNEVELIPIDEMLDSEEPVLLVPKLKTNKKSIINSHKKLDDYNLLYLVNQVNPMVKKVVEDFLEKESRKR